MATQETTTSKDRNGVQDILLDIRNRIRWASSTACVIADDAHIDEPIASACSSVDHHLQEAQELVNELELFGAKLRSGASPQDTLQTKNLSSLAYERFQEFRNKNEALPVDKVRAALDKYQWTTLENSDHGVTQDRYITQHGWSAKGLRHLLALEQLHESIMPPEDECTVTSCDSNTTDSSPRDVVMSDGWLLLYECSSMLAVVERALAGDDGDESAALYESQIRSIRRLLGTAMEQVEKDCRGLEVAA